MTQPGAFIAGCSMCSSNLNQPPTRAPSSSSAQSVQWRCREVPLKVGNTHDIIIDQSRTGTTPYTGFLPLTAALASLVRLQDTLFGEERKSFLRACAPSLNSKPSPFKMLHSSAVYQKALCSLMQDSALPLTHTVKATQASMRTRQALLEAENAALWKQIQARPDGLSVETVAKQRIADWSAPKMQRTGFIDCGPLCDPPTTKRRAALALFLETGKETWRVRDVANDVEADLSLLGPISDSNIAWKVTCEPIFGEHCLLGVRATADIELNLMDPGFSVTLKLSQGRGEHSSYELQFLHAKDYEYWRDIVAVELFPLRY